jgi:tetratricopeptide (TPR) repeat protein
VGDGAPDSPDPGSGVPSTADSRPEGPLSGSECPSDAPASQSTRIARRPPDGPPPKLEEAKALYMGGEYPDALLALDRILAKDPKNADALTLRGRVWLNLSSPRAAEADLRAATVAGEETAERLVAHAEALHRLRRHDEATRRLKRALEIDPQTARAHSVLAAIHLFHARNEEAREEIDLALSIDPEESMALALRKRLK